MASNACLNPIREKKGLLGDQPGLRPADVFLPDLWGYPVAVAFAVTCQLQQRYKNTTEPAESYAITQKHKKYDGQDLKKQIFILLLQLLILLVDGLKKEKRPLKKWQEEGQKGIWSVLQHIHKIAGPTSV